MHSPRKASAKIFLQTDSYKIWYIISTIVSLSVHQILNNLEKILAKIDQNFEQVFSHAHPKAVKAIVLKLLSFIHSPLKVERFELLVNQNNIELE